MTSVLARAAEKLAAPEPAPDSPAALRKKAQQAAERERRAAWTRDTCLVRAELAEQRQRACAALDGARGVAEAASRRALAAEEALARVQAEERSIRDHLDALRHTVEHNDDRAARVEARKEIVAWQQELADLEPVLTAAGATAAEACTASQLADSAVTAAEADLREIAAAWRDPLGHPRAMRTEAWQAGWALRAWPAVIADPGAFPVAQRKAAARQLRYLLSTRLGHEAATIEVGAALRKEAAEHGIVSKDGLYVQPGIDIGANPLRGAGPVLGGLEGRQLPAPGHGLGGPVS